MTHQGRGVRKSSADETLSKDVKYLRFRQDINSLAKSLDQLATIFENAGNQCSRRPWHTDANHISEVLQVLPEVTGDFHKTLKDCQRLLRDHARLEYGRTSIAANFSWWTSTEKDVNNLRQRLNFHITKVAFIAKPLEIQLLWEIRREVRLLRSDVADIRGILTNNLTSVNDSSNGFYLQAIHIPDDLNARFVEAVEINRPSTFLTGSEWPVKEGFDALVSAFAKSTVEFNSRQQLGQNVPDGPQYLNLIKSLWIMRHVKASLGFQATGQDSLWADYMRELEADVVVQFRRFDNQQLVRPPRDVILQLPDEYYSIWVDEEPPLRSLDMVEQRPLEEKILELSLPQSYGTRQSSLKIFRKSEYEFRLATVTKMTDNPLFHSEESSNVNMNFTRLIPAYATPGMTSTTDNIALCNDRGQHEEWHFLKCPRDAANLQRALTGYRIHHDMSNFSWCLNGSHEDGDSGSGRLQLWQLKPLANIAPIQPDGDAEALRNLSTATSPDTIPEQMSTLASGQWGVRSLTARSQSETSRTTASSTAAIPTLESRATSNTTMSSGSSITTTVNGPCGDGIELVRPEVPSLIIFTKCKSRYTLLHLKHHEEEQGLFSWDLAMFRYPRRPEYKHVKTVDKMKYLDLEFSTIAAKEEFLKELAELENVRNVDHNNYETYISDGKKRARL
ncbi:MAG: hypothetical protein Q9223_004543 [Gallowayella weberi]